MTRVQGVKTESSRDYSLITLVSVLVCGFIASPIGQFGSNGARAALDEDPDDVCLGLIPYLVLCPGGDHGKVAGI